MDQEREGNEARNSDADHGEGSVRSGIKDDEDRRLHRSADRRHRRLPPSLEVTTELEISRMATAAAAPSLPHAGYSESSGLWSWLTTVDHKRIGALYLYTALTWFAIGGLEAMLIRAQLQGPNGRLVSAETYNQLFTMH